MAFLKRIAQSGFYSARYFKSPAASFNRFGYRELSQLEKPDLVDETEKLRSDIEKMGSQLRYGLDKARTGQPLVPNNEMGRCLRDEIAKQHAELDEMRKKLAQGTEALRAKLEEAQLDVMKYCTGIMAVSAVVIVVSAFYRFVSVS